MSILPRAWNEIGLCHYVGMLLWWHTLAQICSRYYWPKLTHDVKHHVKTCSDCQRRKAPPVCLAGLLKPVAPPSQPFKQIGMDLLGPFLKSHDGNCWIIVATDYLTRYCETKAYNEALQMIK